jgi:hypothetical protein
MRYHDWHLSGYSVLERGTRIILHLVWDYPTEQRLENHIEFSDVAAYRFIHSDGAIITDIEEAPIAAYLKAEEAFILSAAKQNGLRYCERDLRGYEAYLEKEGFRYWSIGSAIGFEGFVVAKAVGELTSSPPSSFK